MQRLMTLCTTRRSLLIRWLCLLVTTAEQPLRQGYLQH
jgi:hypothetical protein